MRISVIALALFLGGCMSTAQRTPVPDDPSYAPVTPDMPRERLAKDGSIFSQATANSLYSDVKARRVGDIITVVLQENTTASKSAQTSTSKESGVDLDPITGLNGNNVTIGGNSLQLGVDSSNDFSGNASTSQNNNLFGNISVTVMKVLPNQNLVVRGEKWMTINNGDEFIRLTGIVRSADISPDNEVVSSKVANARIQYSGTGSFARAQEKGWLTRFFDSSWWPF
ncbi:Flagellar L-ring protein [Saliniradius amylolyticus]|uniref:Flagellar L-ring protein n=1 Tax=Saliniradius amylolyticus TaxID=2183582 RepID=A0A2S2E4K0_9ALTE|nr:flagellar basal body L-ring protein FlgH [Saliniradius amylolyticus]AWL12574.1 Flagellar L-ring protein [Saliniradius amylolyticus]